jgi:putative acetyltransferase
MCWKSTEKIVGGCGIKQVDNTDENICELQRMFILPTSRGKGLGKELLKICLTKAKEFKYDSIYLGNAVTNESCHRTLREYGVSSNRQKNWKYGA